eukprot:TRINITY_DN6058_c0_g2_i3.p2 TRINITY_DN6058_c0_g2~~TRINITY_DN6058_c0_g2_i3.p2  ORF type:complete len:518 (-),score=39.61 TRINITY_DN6058_c0_g2_i3:911-2464(-)
MYNCTHTKRIMRLRYLLLLYVCAYRLTVWARPPFIQSTKSYKTYNDRRESCVLEWYNQTVDHFSWRVPKLGNSYWYQRYYICDKYWKPNEDTKLGEGVIHPIFFYAGQEASVESQVGEMGLLWDYAPQFGAVLLFVEHRYYGASQPFGNDSVLKDPTYLSTEQALADYATVIQAVKLRYGGYNQPVVAFGASYGGQLATYIRLKYPHIVSAAVSSSGPVGVFPNLHPPYNTETYWEVVTKGATQQGGSPQFCAQNVRKAFSTLFQTSALEGGLRNISSAFNLCSPLRNEEDLLLLAYVIQGAFDALAMYNYPFPLQKLPARAYQHACEYLREEFMDGTYLLEGLANASWVYYRTHSDKDCLQLQVAGPAAGDKNWEYLVCTEMLAQEQPYWPTNGVTDMFWDQGNYTFERLTQHCLNEFGVVPKRDWGALQYGGKNLYAASNIVFFNSLFDPWSTGGVLSNLSDRLVAVTVAMGGHHGDIYGKQPVDTPELDAVRDVEMTLIWDWVMKPQLQPTIDI